jgi:hypothetical protein
VDGLERQWRGTAGWRREVEESKYALFVHKCTFLRREICRKAVKIPDISLFISSIWRYIS